MNAFSYKITQIGLSFLLIGALNPDMARGQSKTDSISTFLQAEMIKRNIPGLQVAVIRNGKLELLRSFGLANIEHAVSVNDSTLFSINSATKAFTGVAIMQLVEKNRITIDMPISHYLDSLPNHWQAVTIYQLLTHTSGLPDFIDPGKGGFINGLKYAEAWEAIKDYPMEFVAGTRMRYNQTNYVLLGLLIEKLNGKPFEQVIQEQQFNPCGMKKSGFGDSRDIILNKAPTYMLSKQTEKNFVKGKTLERSWEEFPELRATAGINSNARELANWLLSLQNGLLLKSQTLQTMWQAGKLNNGAYSGWAAGWVARRNLVPRAVAGIGGSRSWFYIYPDHQLAVIILTNMKSTQPEDLAPEVAGFYYPELKSTNGGTLPESIMPLRRLLEQQGYAKAIPLAEKMRRQDDKFYPSERDLSNWAYYLLLLQNKKNEATEIFKLYTHLYPASANAYDSLGEGYEAIGSVKNAIECYRQVLKLEAKNEHASGRLKILLKK
jgi:CubicO group peptidase (beta-lactamase class C family)